MRRELIIAGAASLLAPNVRGQEVVRFDTVHLNVVGSFADGQAVFEIDSGYRVFSTQRGLADMSQDIFVSDFDTSGGLISERTFQTYPQDDFGNSSPIVATVNGYFASVSRFGVGAPLDSMFLYRFNQEGDTLWTRYFAADTAYAMRGLARTGAGDLLVTGIHNPGLVNGGNEAFVFRLDSLGAIKSHYDYATFDGDDVAEGKEGSWYVCGQGNIGSDYGYPILIRSDTSGNELWRRSDTIYGYYFGLIATHDSCIVALGDRGDGIVGPYAKIVKYNAAGAQQWMRQLHQGTYSQWRSRLHAGFERADHSFIVAGTMRDTTYGQNGMVYHLDSEGNPLWQRFYAHYPNNTVNQEQVFWDVKQTSDGGLVLTGECNSEDFPYPQLWLLKLDSMGCLVPGCGSVGVEEYLDGYQPLLRISPNPARDVVSVALDLPEGGALQGQVHAQLLDTNGKLVLHQGIMQQFNALRGTLDVSALPAGTYYLHLRDAKRWLAGSQVVVE
jgi:hypothetical protein